MNLRLRKIGDIINGISLMTHLLGLGVGRFTKASCMFIHKQVLVYAFGAHTRVIGLFKGVFDENLHSWLLV